MVFRSVSTWPVGTAALNTRPAGLAERRILIAQAVDAVKLLTARPGKARVVRLDAAVAATVNRLGTACSTARLQRRRKLRYFRSL